MKIAIITQPVGTNYGGMLQAAALQHYLQQQGHTVQVVWYQCIKLFYLKGCLDILKRGIKKYILRKEIGDIVPLWFNKKKQSHIYCHTRSFIADNIVQTPYVRRFGQLNKMHFDAFIVGSDQVWRPRYNSDHLPDMFLTFTKGQQVKRIAYAASFGVDNWEYDERQTRMAKQAVRCFDAVSVRERSAIALCKEHLAIDAQQVIDPTLLFGADYYKQWVSSTIKTNDNELFVYILDNTPQKKEIIELIRRQTSGTVYSIFDDADNERVGSELVMPPVEQWLTHLANARYVITDSFHGTVFSILFHKPFFVLANSARGNTRCRSLLQLFDLQERFITTPDAIADNVNKALDREAVDNRLNELRNVAYQFINNALNNERP